MNIIFLGAGIGSIILTIVWIFALFCCFISLRTKYNLGPLVVTVVLFFTVLLLSIPRNIEQPPSVESSTKILDPLFVWRTFALLFLGLSAICSGTIAITSYVMDVKQARPIKHWCNIDRERHLFTSIRLNGKYFVVKDHDDFVRNVMNSDIPVIVNFHADWCGPCHVLTPKLKELVQHSNDGIALAIVDVEKHADLVHTFEVAAVPAVLAIRNGLVIDKFIGLVDSSVIENLIVNLGTKTSVDRKNRDENDDNK